MLRKLYDYWNVLPCPGCGSRDGETTYESTVWDYITHESVTSCAHCGEQMQYWVTGYNTMPSARLELWRSYAKWMRDECHWRMIRHWGWKDFWTKGI